MSKVAKRTNKRSSKIVIEEVKDETKEMAAVSTPHFNEEFASGKFVVYSRFKEQEFIHIRDYGVNGERTYPTKRGVCLTPARLKALMGKFDEIDEQLKQTDAKAPYKVQQSQYKTHLGGGIYAAIDEKFSGLNLRRYWVPEGQLSIVPTKNGVYLTSAQWTILKEDRKSVV